MVTPFDGRGEIDFSLAGELARFLVSQGSQGLVVAGSTGEGTSLTDSEKLDLFKCVAEAVNVPVIAGSTDANTLHSVDLTRKASDTGVAGILATTPAYARPNQAGIAGHLGAIAEATSLPVMLYDIPSRTGRKIASATTIQIAQRHQNVIALKDASGDLEQAKETKATLGEKFDLYSGDDSLTNAFIKIGACGVVSVAGHWASPEFAAMIAVAIQGDESVAGNLEGRLQRSCAFEGTEKYPNPMPSKAAMRHLGFAVGECRLPHGLSDAQLDAEAASVVDELVALRV